ncbi:hypothetical protein BST61_g2027 [Cercospora zeina]
MAVPWHNAPFTENYQQNAFNGFPYLPEYGHARTAPAEEPFIIHRSHGHSGRGWYQGGRKLNKLRSKKYWVRPVDDARHGTLGRLKDALTGEGPDVYVVANADKRTFHRDRPSRMHWSGWDKTGLKWAGANGDANWTAPAHDVDWYPRTTYHVPWARRDGRDQVYNFRTREYDRLTGANRWNFWSDAHYPRGKRGQHGIPATWRMWNGKWCSTVDPSAGSWPGGRPLN